MKALKHAQVDQSICVACGACAKECPIGVIQIIKGCFAKVDPHQCLGCGKCKAVCPAGCIRIFTAEVSHEN